MRSPLTEKYLPKKLSKKELDDYLARGWYRLGAQIFTCQYLFFKEKLFSPVWIRLPLKDYTFRKRLRKIFNRNRRKFTVVIQPQNLTHEKQDLYQKYRKSFHSPIAVTLVYNLQDSARTTIYDTQEICIYHEDKLVACSFFDIGENSLASILGIYDPDYQQDSLGFYSMLLEIEWGLENGYEYYYPGYIVPQYDKFDYKLRIGKPEELEFFDLRTSTWKAQSLYDENETITLETRQKLLQLSYLLMDNEVSSHLLFYPCYEPYLVKRFGIESMKSPLFLSCFSDYFVQPQYLIFYDYFKQTFGFYDCSISASNTEQSDDKGENAGEMLDFLKNPKLVFETKSPQDIVIFLKKLQLKLIELELTKTDNKTE
jgi:arginine-tRNA-protein transferase